MKNPQSWLPLTSHILVQSTVAKFCKNVHLCNDHLPNAAILRLRNTWLANCVEIEFPPNLHTAPWNIHYQALLLLLFRNFWWQNGWLTANNWRRWSSIYKWSPAWPRTMYWEGRSNQRSTQEQITSHNYVLQGTLHHHDGDITLPTRKIGVYTPWFDDINLIWTNPKQGPSQLRIRTSRISLEEVSAMSWSRSAWYSMNHRESSWYIMILFVRTWIG